MNTAIKDIDTYLSMQSEEDCAMLQKLREIIKAAAPEAEETIGYGMPMFRYHGMLVAFAAAKNHYGFYPCDGSTVAFFKDELKDFGLSKGAMRLPKDKPLPAALIKKIVKWRMKENIAKEKSKQKQSKK